MPRVRTIVGVGVAAAIVGAAAPEVYAYVTNYRWATTTVTFYANPANQDVPADVAEAALTSALHVWSTQPESPFRFHYGGRVRDTSIGLDYRNVIIFRNETSPSGSGVIASAHSWISGGHRVDSDIIFWDGSWTFFTGTSGCSRGAYIEDIATHELGHSLGLGHSTEPAATMYAKYSRCSQALRHLSDDDIAGVRALYGASGPSRNQAPSVSIASPSNGTSAVQGALVTFSGSASDAEDGNLTSALAWTSSLEGVLGVGGSVSRSLAVVGAHAITATVTDSGGLTASTQVTVHVTEPVLNTAPVVSISSPGDGSAVAAGTAVHFAGSATDAEDGTLTNSLQWTSSVDGMIGSGSGFLKVLSSGAHVIVAQVTDSGGLSAVRQVSVTVAEATTGPNLKATGRKVKGQPIADLTWSGLTATQVDVYRDGTRVARTSNSGGYSDALDRKGGGSATYQVCAAGTMTCSNLVPVTF
jgi:hypothetical protein